MASAKRFFAASPHSIVRVLRLLAFLPPVCDHGAGGRLLAFRSMLIFAARTNFGGRPALHLLLTPRR